MPKLTAANSLFLKAVKKLFNTPIFKHTSILLNDGGQVAADAFVEQLFRAECRDASMAALKRGEMP